MTTIDELFARLGSLPSSARCDAVYILQRLGRKRHAAFLVGLFGRERSLKVRLGIIEALGDIGGKRALRALCQWVKDPGQAPELRHAGSYQLAFFRDGDETLVQVLLGVAEASHEDVMLRGQCIEALAYQVDSTDRRRKSWRRAVDVLMSCLTDDEGEVRFWAIFALGSLGASRALDPIGRLARSDDFTGTMGWENREEAKDVLHLIGRGEWPEPDAAERSGRLQPKRRKRRTGT